MAGDADNVTVWADADVLIGDVAATIPSGGADFTLNDPDHTPTPVTGQWDFAGILDGGQGFPESQSADGTDFFGWGKGVTATGRKNLAITRQFTCEEDNLVTLGLRYDTTDITPSADGYEGDLGGRNLQRKLKVAFQVETDGIINRRVSKNYAQIDAIGDVVESEDGIPLVPITVKIYPDSAGKYWAAYKGAAA
jgi:hypothetical protein